MKNQENKADLTRSLKVQFLSGEFTLTMSGLCLISLQHGSGKLPPASQKDKTVFFKVVSSAENQEHERMGIYGQGSI